MIVLDREKPKKKEKKEKSLVHSHKMFSFSRKAAPPSTAAKVTALYRRILRVIKELEPEHQKTYYDYTRIKMQQNANVKDSREIMKLITAAEEELQWVESVLKRKDVAQATPRNSSS